MKITILTLFPEMFEGPFSTSILKNAQAKELVTLSCKNIREFGIGPHQIVDDTPYGGGIGMVMRVDVVKAAIDAARIPNIDRSKEKVILMTADGQTFNQRLAEGYAALEHLIIVCGHYEGIDERIRKYIDEEVSIGDFVLTGGELPAMVITDAVVRLVKGVLKEGVTDAESFSHKDEKGYLLEYPHFTRPGEFDGQSVPEVLMSGNHKAIDEWRMKAAKEKTIKRRPDLLT